MKAESVPGWLSPQDLEAIYEIAKRVKPRTMLEIGSYFGKSSVAWAESFPEATIYCVDIFEGNSPRDLLNSGQEHALKWLRPQLTDEEMQMDTYSLFLKYTWDFPNIRHLRCDSQLLKSHWHGPIVDFVFIDGDHHEESVKGDLDTAQSLTQGKGIIAGHDYDDPIIQGVKKAVDAWHFENKYELKVHPERPRFFELTPLE